MFNYLNFAAGSGVNEFCLITLDYFTFFFFLSLGGPSHWTLGYKMGDSFHHTHPGFELETYNLCPKFIYWVFSWGTP